MIYKLDEFQEERIKSLRTVPNQKIIVTHKPERNNKDGRYSINYEDDLTSAIGCLSHVALKLYLWFGFNQNAYTFALYSETVCKTLDISLSRFKVGIKELIEAGYLTKVHSETSKNKNIYVFTPKQQKSLVSTQVAKKYARGTKNEPLNSIENDTKEKLEKSQKFENDTTSSTENDTTSSTENERDNNTVNNINNTNNIYVSSIEEYNNLPEKKENGDSEIEEHIKENINNSETVLTVDELLPKEENIKDSDTDLSVEESLLGKKEDRTYIDFTVKDDNEIMKTISTLESIGERVFNLPPAENEILTYLKNQKEIHKMAEKNPDEWERKVIYMFAKPCIILAQKNSYAEPQELPKEVDKFTEIKEDDDLPF